MKTLSPVLALLVLASCATHRPISRNISSTSDRECATFGNIDHNIELCNGEAVIVHAPYHSYDNLGYLKKPIEIQRKEAEDFRSSENFEQLSLYAAKPGACAKSGSPCVGDRTPEGYLVIGVYYDAQVGLNAERYDQVMILNEKTNEVRPIRKNDAERERYLAERYQGTEICTNWPAYEGDLIDYKRDMTLDLFDKDKSGRCSLVQLKYTPDDVLHEVAEATSIENFGKREHYAPSRISNNPYCSFGSCPNPTYRPGNDLTFNVARDSHDQPTSYTIEYRNMVNHPVRYLSYKCLNLVRVADYTRCYKNPQKSASEGFYKTDASGMLGYGSQYDPKWRELGSKFE